jgi:UDPglucose 6-dehydrogenase
MEKAREFLNSSVTFAESSYAAAHKADALLILTDWEEFAALDLDRIKTALKFPVIIDGRNLYMPKRMAESGFTYVSVGRPDAAPQKSAVKAPRA